MEKPKGEPEWLRFVELRNAVMYYCPECKSLNFRREIFTHAAPDALIPGTDIPFGGSSSYQPKWYVCDVCETPLTEQQQEVARPMAPGGGSLLPAWEFTCESCGRDSFDSVVIYYGDGHQSSRNVVVCVHCGTAYKTQPTTEEEDE